MAKTKDTTNSISVKPIIFSGEMVRALLEGRKTQTRRVMKDQPAPYKGGVHPDHVAKHPAPYIDAYCSERKTASNPRGMSNEWCWWTEDDRCGPFVGKCPYKPGDLLWVRETWRGWVPVNAPWQTKDLGVARYTPGPKLCQRVDYRATHDADKEPYRPSTQMPRWASRLTLRVTNVRAERLRDISEDDARAEGVRNEEVRGHTLWSGRGKERPTLSSARQAFLDHIWTDLYGEHDTKSVGANPWVWVYEFEVIRKNVGEVN